MFMDLLKHLGLNLVDIIKLMNLLKDNKEILMRINKCIKKENEKLEEGKQYYKFNNYLIDIEELKIILNDLMKSNQFLEVLKKIIK